MNPSVSIVIPCHDAERWIAGALDSCLAQTYRPLELVVVDDGSTDGSALIIGSYAKQHPDTIRFHRQANRGAPAARSAGLSWAKSGFVWFLDADDYLLPDAVSSLMEALGKDNDIAYGQARYVDASGAFRAARDQMPRSEDAFVSMVEAHPITSSILFRRRALEVCNWDSSLPCAQELSVLARCAIQGFRFRFVPSLVAVIREHRSPGRITTRTSSVLATVLLELYLQFEHELQKRGIYYRQRKAALHYALVHVAIVLWRQAQFDLAERALIHADARFVRESSRFRRRSYHAIAISFGLRASHFAWVWRHRLLKSITANPILSHD